MKMEPFYINLLITLILCTVMLLVFILGFILGEKKKEKKYEEKYEAPPVRSFKVYNKRLIEGIAEKIIQEEIKERKKREEERKKEKEKERLGKILEQDSVLSIIIKKIWEERPVLGRVKRPSSGNTYLEVDTNLKGRNDENLEIVINSVPRAYSVMNEVILIGKNLPGLPPWFIKNLGQCTDEEIACIERWIIKNSIE